MSRVILSLSASFAILLGVHSAPAEAGKISGAIAKAATSVAVRSATRGSRNGADKDESSASTSSGVDAEARAAHAKAKLDEESNRQTPVFAGATDLSLNANKGIVCLAGCN